MNVALCIAAALLATGEKPKMMILGLQAAPGVEAQLASGLNDAIAVELSQRGFFEVLAAKDLQTLLNVERQRQLLGCSEEGACLTELADAVGARFVLSGQLNKLGAAYQLSLEGLDTLKARPLGRTTRLSADVETLRAQIPYAVAEATGVPLPPPPSNVLSYSLLGLGAAGILTGAYFGIDGISREGQINQTIKQGQLGNTPLATAAYYQQLGRDAAHEKTVSLVGLGIGAAATAAGILTFRRDPNGGSRLALVPQGAGLGLAGVFP